MLMEIIRHGVAVAVSATALWAAWKWWRSSKGRVDPGWALPGTGGHIEPVIDELRNMDLHCATLTAFQTT